MKVLLEKVGPERTIEDGFTLIADSFKAFSISSRYVELDRRECNID